MERSSMNIQEIKNSVEFNLDLMLQRGYELGSESVLSRLDEIANSEWNMGNKATAQVITNLIARLKND